MMVTTWSTGRAAEVVSLIAWATDAVCQMGLFVLLFVSCVDSVK